MGEVGSWEKPGSGGELSSFPTKSPLALFFCGRRTMGFILSVP